MTVAELIEELRKQDPDAIVLFPAEGSGCYVVNGAEDYGRCKFKDGDYYSRDVPSVQLDTPALNTVLLS